MKLTPSPPSTEERLKELERRLSVCKAFDKAIRELEALDPNTATIVVRFPEGGTKNLPVDLTLAVLGHGKRVTLDQLKSNLEACFGLSNLRNS